MKLLVVLTLAVVALARPNEFYDSKYDNFNADEMISNPRLLKSFTLCILDEGKCSPEGSEIKTWIPEAISSSCGKCTDIQKTLVAKSIKAIKEQLSAEYEKLSKIHDPEGKYQESLNAFIVKYSA